MSDGSQMEPFRFQGYEVRFVGTMETPEWVAADVVLVLYPESRRENLSNYLSKIPSEWKGNKPVITPGGRQSMTTLYEPGLYALIVRSESPLAVPFQKWVYEEVLPSLRKTGTYSIPGYPGTKADPELDQIRLQNIRLGLDLMYELGGVDERTQLALNDAIRDIVLRDQMKRTALPGAARREYPVSDRARDLGYKPTRKQLIQMGKIAAQFYRLAHDNQDPPRREQFVDGTTRMVFCYSEADVEILDRAIALVMNPPSELPPSEDDSSDNPF